MIGVIFVVRYFIMKKQNIIYDAKNRQQRKIEYDFAEQSSIEMSGASKYGESGDASRLSHMGPLQPNTNSKLNSNLYQEQYDPNQDFAVFGMSDNTKGGIDSLQNKIN